MREEVMEGRSDGREEVIGGRCEGGGDGRREEII